MIPTPCGATTGVESMGNGFQPGQKVWAVVAYSVQSIRGVRVTYRGESRRGRFLEIEGKNGDRHFVPPQYVFATWQALAAQHGNLHIEEEPPDATA
jgi:hypothetical protein